jgi:DNA replication and repair protein RecF
MSLMKLGLRGIRCINQAGLELGPTNVVTGPNGAGKTSLLEAVYILSRGRSFRTRRLERVRRHGADGLRVTGVVESGGRQEPLGIEFDGNGRRARCAGAPVTGMAGLAERLAAEIIEPHSHLLVEGQPARRRRFMDWGVFHVEHTYLRDWRRFRRALIQRNALLRNGAAGREVRAWDAEYVAAGRAVDAARREWLHAFRRQLPAFFDVLIPEGDVELAYRSGWSRDLSLDEALARSIETDRRRGATAPGPHRADIAIWWNRAPAKDTVSRGQQKLLAIGLLLAQTSHIARTARRSPILLIDDPAAELDRDAFERVVRVLKSQSLQTVVTGVDPKTVAQLDSRDSRWFHVEQGVFSEMI